MTAEENKKLWSAALATPGALDKIGTVIMIHVLASRAMRNGNYALAVGRLPFADLELLKANVEGAGRWAELAEAFTGMSAHEIARTHTDEQAERILRCAHDMLMSIPDYITLPHMDYLFPGQDWREAIKDYVETLVPIGDIFRTKANA